MRFSQMLRVLLLTVPILATLAGTILLLTLPLAWGLRPSLTTLR